ncbi:MAG: hypothetical protein J0M18_20595 [Ignavibacteria bacterium]|nr:hypothetical protein [Ignavibacteria bacterium]
MTKAFIIAVLFFISSGSVFSKSASLNFTPADTIIIEKQNSSVPEKFDIYSPRNAVTSQNYIMIDIPENSSVSVKMFDYDDKFLTELFDKIFDVGTYYFDPYNYLKVNSLSSGIYYLQIKSGNFSKEKKIYYVK